MFQIVRLTLDDNGEVEARRPLQPLFELREDAMAMAEFDASRLWGDYGRDEERDCWWATEQISLCGRAGPRHPHCRLRSVFSAGPVCAGTPKAGRAQSSLRAHVPVIRLQ